MAREDHETGVVVVGGVDMDLKRELNVQCNSRALPVISDCAENRMCIQRQQTTPVR